MKFHANILGPGAVLLFLYSAMASAAELSADYLAGDWCHTHIQFGKERQDEGRYYRFEPDGTFSQQVSLGSDKMQGDFRYQIKPGALKLSPVFPGEMEVLSVSDDEFVLKWFGEVHFARGRCP